MENNKETQCMENEVVEPVELGEEDLQLKLKKQEQEIEELSNRLLRMQADFDNFRRRSRKEAAEMAHLGSEKVISGLLPVIDNFERALSVEKNNSEIEQYAAGMELIYRQLNEVLEKEGLCKIEAINQPFDPEMHYAVAQIPSTEHEDNQIIEEIQKGYLLKEKIIRPSTVCVAKREETN